MIDEQAPAGGLAGSSIIVTGASQGIGKAVCLELALLRARLTLAARDAAALEQVAAACRERGGEAVVVPTDVSQPGDCERLVRQAVAAWGSLDALINNAGIDMIARFDEVADLQLFERLMRVNYLGYVYPTYYALPKLRRSRGRLVAVSSLAGLTGVPTRTGYAASKHAVFGFFDSLRIELAGTGVSVTLVAPDLGRQGRPRTEESQATVVLGRIWAGAYLTVSSGHGLTGSEREESHARLWSRGEHPNRRPNSVERLSINN